MPSSGKELRLHDQLRCSVIPPPPDPRIIGPEADASEGSPQAGRESTVTIWATNKPAEALPGSREMTCWRPSRSGCRCPGGGASIDPSWSSRRQLQRPSAGEGTEQCTRAQRHGPSITNRAAEPMGTSRSSPGWSTGLLRAWWRLRGAATRHGAARRTPRPPGAPAPRAQARSGPEARSQTPR